jgi:predicted MFS family arabinose efflux permease
VVTAIAFARPTGGFLAAGILALVAAQGIGRFAYTPLLPAMQAATGLDTTQAGLLASANYVGYLAGAVVIALVAPRARRVGLLRLAAIAVAATTAAMAVTTSVVVWGVVRFTAGLASAGVLVLVSGVVLDELRRQNRAALSGWLYSGTGLGIVATGLAVAATLERVGWGGVWVILALATLVAFVPCWFWLPGAGRPAVDGGADSPPPPDPGAPRARRLLFAGYFLYGVGYIVTGTFLVAIVEQTPGLAGLGADIWIVVGLAIVPSSPLWGGVAERVGFAPALAAAYALLGASILLPLLGGAPAAFGAAVLFGGTFSGIAAMTLTLAARLAPQRSAALIGALTAAFGLGQVLGPLLAVTIAGRTGSFAPALVVAAGLVLLGAILMAALPTEGGSRRSSDGAAWRAVSGR